MWRDRLYDEGILNSLVEDLQLFWQLKATRWEKVERQIAQRRSALPAQRGEKQISVQSELRNILENNADYHDLKERLLDELQEALVIARFMGSDTPIAILELAFEVPLPDNTILEQAVSEAQALAMHARYAPYTFRNLIALFNRT